jgi:hypothetical protein
VPSLFKKIRSGVYAEPAYLSAPAKHLLSRLLTVDPLRRATVDEIRADPWFAASLPPTLFPVDGCATETEYDKTLVARVCRDFQVYPEQVVEQLQAGDDNDQLVRAYNMLVENRALRPDEAEAEADGMATLSIHGDPAAASATAAPGTPTAAATSAAAVTAAAAAAAAAHSSKPGIQKTRRGSGGPAPKPLTGLRAGRQTQLQQLQQLHETKEKQAPGHSSSSIGSGTSAGGATQLVTVKRSRWHLGMRSQNSPEDVMSEVFRALKALGFVRV